MKKILVLLFLMAFGTGAFAQKSYLNVAAVDLWGEQYQYITLSGDVPSDLKWYYSQSDNMSIGNLLNILSAKGFVVESMCSLNSGTGSDRGVNYLLSRNSSSNHTIIEGDVNIDGEVTIADVNRVINIILGIVRENPNLLEQYGITIEP